ncbi:MAG TPA: replication-associated recombination protein A [Thermomicrobiales bacterium]|nr:replication-associated recombination protein A [Thermomicrobiales bacterium]
MATQMDLFEANRRSVLQRMGPLAARMRPERLDDFVGQDDVLGEGSVLRRSIERDRLSSIILWGPPGVGKTTLARLIAGQTKAHFIQLSAVSAGVADLRAAVKEAADRLGMNGQRTVLFIDEIHRFNKAQQDAILPYVEDGTVILVGATTENPSFEVNAPLLSRSRVVVLKSLGDEHIREIVTRALRDAERGLGADEIEIEEDGLDALVNLSNGDARFALNTLEIASVAVDAERRITGAMVHEATQRRAAAYDKSGEAHYDTISALHKSLRDSDADASLYWLARMIERGDDPLYVARRLVRFATEDVGLADPQALVVAMAAQQAVHFLGLPEGKLALAELAVYLALAPKSNAIYRGYSAAQEDVDQTRNEPVPLHLRNAVTGLMRDIGYGKGYEYAHDLDEGVSSQSHLPDNLTGRVYYHPTNRGYEATLRERQARLRETLETRHATKGSS